MEIASMPLPPMSITEHCRDLAASCSDVAVVTRPLISHCRAGTSSWQTTLPVYSFLNAHHGRALYASLPATLVGRSPYRPRLTQSVHGNARSISDISFAFFADPQPCQGSW